MSCVNHPSFCVQKRQRWEGDGYLFCLSWQQVYSSAWEALTKCHSLDGIEGGLYFIIVPYTFKINMTTGLFSAEVLKMTSFSLGASLEVRNIAGISSSSPLVSVWLLWHWRLPRGPVFSYYHAERQNLHTNLGAAPTGTAFPIGL